ncbi:MAG: aminoglycoside phosphotransferase family protein [Anaerolineae bacterium]|nr:aminoglycoside phosphotransferase family protein [Anaerolineae bacterium]
MIDTQLNVIVSQATGLDPAAILIRLRPPLDYQSNRLYDIWAGGRHLIAKEFLKPDEFQDAPRREFSALKRLATLDIAPQPVFYAPDPTPVLGPVVLYQFMEGKAWDRRKPSAAELSQLAALWLQVNALRGDDLWLSRGYERPLHERETRFMILFQAYAAWADAEYPPGRQASALCLDQFEKVRAAVAKLSTCDPPLCFCRSDPRFANVIARPDGQLGLVDWEDCGLRDPARDLADIVTHPNQEDLLTWQEWQPLIEPYTAGRTQVDPELERRMHLYLAIFPVFWLAMAIQGGLRRAKANTTIDVQVNRLPINERMRRSLARAMAWPEVDFSSQLETLAEVTFFPKNQIRI